LTFGLGFLPFFLAFLAFLPRAKAENERLIKNYRASRERHWEEFIVIVTIGLGYQALNTVLIEQHVLDTNAGKQLS
jgi:hypothetical protein